MSFSGLKVLCFESRRGDEVAQLARERGGDVLVAPALREAPLDSNEAVFLFAERLFAGDFEAMIFLSGVGARELREVLQARYGTERLPEALKMVATAARSPEAAAALRHMRVPITIEVPAPHTWREVLAATEGWQHQRIAISEYGRSNPELAEGLRARGAQVTPVRAFRYDLPEDLEPLREAARGLAAGTYDVVLFTTAAEVAHLFRIAAEQGLAGQMPAALRRTLVASIGPATSELLQEVGIQPDLIPSEPKIGALVLEAAEQAERLLRGKRA